MKALSFALLLMASVAFVLGGCSDNPGPAVTPTSTTANYPGSLAKIDGPGAWIVRGQYNNWWCVYNDEVVVIFGVNDAASVCDGTGGEVFDFKEVLLPNTDPALRRIVEQSKGSGLTAKAWDASLFTGDACDLYSNFEPLAVGTVDAMYKDNDLMAWAQDNPNVNAFGYHATGKLTGPTGQEYNFSFRQQSIWDPDGTRFKTKWEIQWIPTGRK